MSAPTYTAGNVANSPETNGNARCFTAREAERLPYDIHGRSYGFAVGWCRYARFCCTPHQSPSVTASPQGGSEPSAASGRRSEVSDCRRSGVQASNRPAGAALSESQWQRSKKSRKSVSPKIFSGTATGEPKALPRRCDKLEFTALFCAASLPPPLGEVAEHCEAGEGFYALSVKNQRFLPALPWGEPRALPRQRKDLGAGVDGDVFCTLSVKNQRFLPALP